LISGLLKVSILAEFLLVMNLVGLTVTRDKGFGTATRNIPVASIFMKRKARL
jgi:hypothetical protein